MGVKYVRPLQATISQMTKELIALLIMRMYALYDRSRRVLALYLCVAFTIVVVACVSPPRMYRHKDALRSIFVSGLFSPGRTRTQPMKLLFLLDVQPLYPVWRTYTMLFTPSINDVSIGEYLL